MTELKINSPTQVHSLKRMHETKVSCVYCKIEKKAKQELMIDFRHYPNLAHTTYPPVYKIVTCFQ